MARPAANYNPSKLDGGATSFVPLLYHNLGDLSRGFLKLVSKKLASDRERLHRHLHPMRTEGVSSSSSNPICFPSVGWLPPLDTNSIPYHTPEVNLAECTKSGEIIYTFLSHFSLDKLLGLWYNGKTCRLGRRRHAKKLR